MTDRAPSELKKKKKQIERSRSIMHERRWNFYILANSLLSRLILDISWNFTSYLIQKSLEFHSLKYLHHLNCPHNKSSFYLVGTLVNFLWNVNLYLPGNIYQAGCSSCWYLNWIHSINSMKIELIFVYFSLSLGNEIQMVFIWSEVYLFCSFFWGVG